LKSGFAGSFPQVVAEGLGCPLSEFIHNVICEFISEYQHEEQKELHSLSNSFAQALTCEALLAPERDKILP
jgi:hypothetical protein